MNMADYPTLYSRTKYCLWCAVFNVAIIHPTVHVYPLHYYANSYKKRLGTFNIPYPVEILSLVTSNLSRFYVIDNMIKKIISFSSSKKQY